VLKGDPNTGLERSRFIADDFTFSAPTQIMLYFFIFFFIFHSKRKRDLREFGREKKDLKKRIWFCLMEFMNFPQGLKNLIPEVGVGQ